MTQLSKLWRNVNTIQIKLHAFYVCFNISIGFGIIKNSVKKIKENHENSQITFIWCNWRVYVWKLKDINFILNVDVLASGHTETTLKQCEKWEKVKAIVLHVNDSLVVGWAFSLVLVHRWVLTWVLTCSSFTLVTKISNGAKIVQSQIWHCECDRHLPHEISVLLLFFGKIKPLVEMWKFQFTLD